MKMLGLLVFAMGFQAAASGTGTFTCKNTTEDSSFTLVRTLHLKDMKLEVSLAGMNSSMAEKFKFVGSEIQSAGDSLVFVKPGVSRAEVKVEEVTPNVYVGMLSAQLNEFDDAVITNLMICEKK